MKPVNNIEQSITSMKFKTSPALDERILSAAEKELIQTNNTREDENQFSREKVRFIMKLNWIKYTAAAAALIAIIAGVHFGYKRISVESDKSAPQKATSETKIANQDVTPKPESSRKLVPLDFQLPKPCFESTPLNFTRIPNLKKPSGTPRPPFFAPVGTVNLSRGRPVSSSNNKPLIGKINYITDGNKEAADGCYVELAPGLQYITMDLGEECRIYANLFWHFHKQARAYYDVIVQIADDADFTQNVRTLFNNDHDNSAGMGVGKDTNYIETNEGKLVDAKGAIARYVRLYSNGSSANTLNHYTEVEVYGLPLPHKITTQEPAKSLTPKSTPETTSVNQDTKPQPNSSREIVPLDIQLPPSCFQGTPENLTGIPNLEKNSNKPRPPFLAPVGTANLARGRQVLCSDDEPIIGDIEYITDGDKKALDGSFVELAPGPQYITLDLGDLCPIYAILFWHYHNEARVYYDVVVQIADDADFIQNVRTLFNNDFDNSASLGVGTDMNYIDSNQGKLVDAKGEIARYVRLYSNGSSANDMNHYTEVEVYGLPNQKK